MAEETPVTHISQRGFEHDDHHGFIVVQCTCGIEIGAAPDEETALDMAMEHAWRAGRATDGREHGVCACSSGYPSECTAKESETDGEIECYLGTCQWIGQCSSGCMARPVRWAR